jgi:hypothetical protein
MECKENDVNDADIDDRFPADIEKAANRATLTFINKYKITSVKSLFLLVLKNTFFVRHCQNLRIFSYVNGF